MLASEYLKKGWCQGDYALSAAGRAVVPESKRAVRWCLSGAMQAAKAKGVITRKQELSLVTYLLDRLPDGWISWQDLPERTQAEVVAMMVEAEGHVLSEVPPEIS